MMDATVGYIKTMRVPRKSNVTQIHKMTDNKLETAEDTDDSDFFKSDEVPNAQSDDPEFSMQNLSLERGLN